MSQTQHLPCAEPEPCQTLRILVVDDDDVDREHLTRLLKQQAFSLEISEADSKQSALSAITKQRFDIVFLDFALGDGDGDGRDLLPAIKKHNNHRCVAVGITAGGNERIAANAIKSGLHEYLPKTDLDATRLHQTITECMHLAAVQAQLRDAAFQLQRRSMYDALTGLPNRNLFFDRLEQSCATYQRQQTAFAVLMLDLDGFKAVNDSRGHATGDEVLREVGARFASVMRASGTMARIGGDEFAAILPGVATVALAHIIAEKLRKTLNLPIIVAGHAFSVGVSIGIALCPQNGTEAPLLMARADHAMYEAKSGLNKIAHHTAEEPAEKTRPLPRALLVDWSAPSAKTNSPCCTNPRCGWTRARLSGSRRWCAGTMSSAGCCRPTRSSPLSNPRPCLTASPMQPSASLSRSSNFGARNCPAASCP
jgi:diguanylate cyclase (GGDEF)-like protein